VTRNIECLRRIDPQSVFTACAEFLAAPAATNATMAKPVPSLAV
jgi:hypothetical protein